jgi:2-polyprenyl-3-methyl-5-hydroxy-6-metoxy-1,4-benzoquinol methylase
LGCGIGDTAAKIANLGAKYVEACDYSDSAILTAQKNHTAVNLCFKVSSIDDITEKFDCIILQEVIEHTDNPFETISQLSKQLSANGHLILTCPSFLNLRGYVWMTLQTLFSVPMSLTDKHFISPFDMQEWAERLNLELDWFTFRHKQAFGEAMAFDMNKRLKNALKDANLPNDKVDNLLNWLLKASSYENETISNGAKALYHFRKY